MGLAGILGGSLAAVQWLAGQGTGLFSLAADPPGLALALSLAAYAGAVPVCEWLHSLSPQCASHRCLL